MRVGKLGMAQPIMQTKLLLPPISMNFPKPYLWGKFLAAIYQTLNLCIVGVKPKTMCLGSDLGQDCQSMSHLLGN